MLVPETSAPPTTLNPKAAYPKVIVPEPPTPKSAVYMKVLVPEPMPPNLQTVNTLVIPRGGGTTCHLCQKTFRFSSHLRRHSLVHSGQKPHVCPQCGKGFSQRSTLRRHLDCHARGTIPAGFMNNVTAEEVENEILS